MAAVFALTEYVEFGPPGAQGSLCGLTLVQRVIGKLCIGDLQVVLAGVQSPQHTVPRPGCRTHTHTGLQLNRWRDIQQNTHIVIHALVGVSVSVPL